MPLLPTAFNVEADPARQEDAVAMKTISALLFVTGAIHLLPFTGVLGLRTLTALQEVELSGCETNGRCLSFPVASSASCR